jgi:hypothetical protein
MAESTVQVATGGTGPKLHTFSRIIGANTVEDEVILHGEPYEASYVIRGTGISCATLDSHILQIMAGATLQVYVDRIIVYQQAAATAAAIVPFDVTRLTTAGTGGTAITPAPFDASDAASGATAMTLPGVKGTEGAVLDIASSYFVQTISASLGVPQSAELCRFDYDRRRVKAIRITAGVTNGIAVKIRAATAGATVHVAAYIRERNF